MEIFSQTGIVSVHKINLKSVIVVIAEVPVKMVLGWHHVAHAPVDFPQAENWETQLVGCCRRLKIKITFLTSSDFLVGKALWSRGFSVGSWRSVWVNKRLVVFQGLGGSD